MAAVTTANGKLTLRGSLNRLGQEQVVAIIVVLLLLVFAVSLPGFAAPSNILGLVRSISILGILGLGMGLIVISRGIDLSEVAIMAGSKLPEERRRPVVFESRASRRVLV